MVCYPAETFIILKQPNCASFSVRKHKSIFGACFFYFLHFVFIILRNMSIAYIV